jgi:L-rhamnose mutarotase
MVVGQYLTQNTTDAHELFEMLYEIKRTTEQSKTMETLPKSECNGKWTDWTEKIYKKRLKTVEPPFAHIKQKMKLHEFTITGIKNTNTEFKLYTIGHNLKRIFNEINTKNN